MIGALLILIINIFFFHLEAIIPENRRIDWSRSGVPGGIPERSVIFQTINAAVYGTGNVDASVVINNAIAACPENQVVYLPPGTYRLDNPVNFGLKKRVTLRGAGCQQTVLRPKTGITAAIMTGQSSYSGEITVVEGYYKGSQLIRLASTTGINAGTMLDLSQDDDPDFYWARQLTRHTGQYLMVKAVNGNWVELEDPLVWNFSLLPRVRYLTSGTGASWCGIENLTISAENAYQGKMIQLYDAYACWLKNVETAGGHGNEHIFMTGCLRCEIRECYIHDTFSLTDGYGILTMSGYGGGGGGRGGCTGTRIENNIISGFFFGIVLETEVGSVIAYNYFRNMRYFYWPNYQVADMNGNHGPHGMMCLYEGNVAGAGVQQDGYHGSVSHITYFRNYFSGKHVDPNRTGNVKLIDLCRFSYYHNVIGNVLGNSDWPRNTTGRYEMSGKPDYFQQTVIYRLGYPNMGNNNYSDTNPPGNPDNGGLDPKVKATLYRWGNYDFQNNQARWLSEEVPPGVPEPPNHKLPASLYLPAKPSWWHNACLWPPIGPDVNGLFSKIPAQLRYEDIVNPQPLKIIAPNGGEVLMQGSVYKVTWSSGGYSGNVHLKLFLVESGVTKEIGSIVSNISDMLPEVGQVKV